MGAVPGTFAVLGGLSTIMGIVVALEVIPQYGGLEWIFWMVLAAILFLITIAFSISQSQSNE